MASKESALKLLKHTSWFQDASEDFLDTVASLMVPVEAEDGHIFAEEAAPIQTFIIIETGVLARTKLSVDEIDITSKMMSFRSLGERNLSREIDKASVLVDTIAGRAQVTGLLHCIREGSTAYATVTARGDVKVWLVSGDEFRAMLRGNADYLWQFSTAMSKELRSGSRSLRALIQKVKDRGTAGETEGRNMLRVLCYDATSWVTESFKPAVELFNKNADDGLEIRMDFTTERLGQQSATYAAGYDAVCTFVNDTADSDVMQTLSVVGVKMIAQRAAGFDRIDTRAARAYGMTVARVPAYSPYAVAEMAIALLMAVNRKISMASSRVKMANFTLDAGLMGMDIHGKTVGVMGTGKIGQILCNIILGFGAKLLCYDMFESDDVKKKGGVYVSQNEILAQSDVLFLMMPLLPATYHTINDSSLSKLKKGVILINTSRGGLVETKSLLKGLHSGIIAGAGMDVYENEGEYFFQDWSARNVHDPDLVALIGNNNVVLTAHQAFFTREAVEKIVGTTLENLRDFKKGLTGMSHPNNCIPSLSD